MSCPVAFSPSCVHVFRLIRRTMIPPRHRSGPAAAFVPSTPNTVDAHSLSRLNPMTSQFATVSGLTNGGGT